MEIQPPSSVEQATARFTGLTDEQVRATIKRIYPYPAINTNLKSNQALEAISATGAYKDFNEKNYIEAHRLLQGVITNPWTSVYEIEQGKTDPFYHDSGLSDIRDLAQNTLGKVTGAPEVNDPRLSFVQNLLHLKTFQKHQDNELTHDYMKNLFLTQVENGSTYYQTQAMRQQQAMGAHTSEKLANTPVVDMNYMLKNINPGKGITPAHPSRKRHVVINATPLFSNNLKRTRLDNLHKRFSGPAQLKDRLAFRQPETPPETPPAQVAVSRPATNISLSETSDGARLASALLSGAGYVAGGAISGAAQLAGAALLGGGILGGGALQGLGGALSGALRRPDVNQTTFNHNYVQNHGPIEHTYHQNNVRHGDTVNTMHNLHVPPPETTTTDTQDTQTDPPPVATDDIFAEVNRPPQVTTPHQRRNRNPNDPRFTAIKGQAALDALLDTPGSVLEASPLVPVRLPEERVLQQNADAQTEDPIGAPHQDSENMPDLEPEPDNFMGANALAARRAQLEEERRRVQEIMNRHPHGLQSVAAAHAEARPVPETPTTPGASRPEGLSAQSFQTPIQQRELLPPQNPSVQIRYVSDDEVHLPLTADEQAAWDSFRSSDGMAQLSEEQIMPQIYTATGRFSEGRPHKFFATLHNATRKKRAQYIPPTPGNRTPGPPIPQQEAPRYAATAAGFSIHADTASPPIVLRKKYKGEGGGKKRGLSENQMLR